MARLYRLYVDESGDHTYHPSPTLPKRYLGLTGIAVEMQYYRTTLHPLLDALKQKHFPHNPDDPVVLHADEIIKRKGVFKSLQNPGNDKAFGDELESLLAKLDIEIFTVVIDKQTHSQRYGRAAFHPYHYCLTVLLERYRGFLEVGGARGDVLAESRGGTEDRELKRIYREVFQNGTRFLSAADFQKVLTSVDIKLKKKSANTSGLQLADMLANPIKQQILINQGVPGVSCGPFSTRICTSVAQKHNPYGRVFLK